ncbi:MAG TPA: hypothetical protein VNL91_04425 [Thermoanaerobaculia bacterium]|nr:hypothetical protein [Thermoanaerobaculia bacterium]
MAHLHTDLPRKFVGEREVADRLCMLDDSRLHLWFEVDYLPGVGDIDLIAWHEDHGLFLIEIKAIELSAIESIDYRHLKVAGRSSTDSPHYQAHRAMWFLKDYLVGRGMQRRPFVVPTALYPKISRREWEEGVRDPRLTGSFAQSILFSDDLESKNALQKRLAYIWENPPVGRRLGVRFRHDVDAFSAFADNLMVQAGRDAARSDQRRLSYLENSHRAEADRDAPADRVVRLAYQGYPGTGKTFRLLRIGVQHAVAGKRVLFLCFNKVLAADVRRLISLSQASGQVEAYDLFDFLDRLRDFNGIAKPPEMPTAEDWAEAVLSRLVDCLPLAYDTVLVDEAQDLQPWAIEFITRLSRHDSSVVVAMAKGQELYGDGKAIMEKLGLKPRQLNRVFRNPRPIFQFAQTFYESRMRPERLESVTRRFVHKSADVDRPLFQVDAGELPAIVKLERVNEVGQSSYRRELERIVTRAVERMVADGASPRDVLLLVPGKGAEYQAALACLQAARQKSIDLVNPSNRRAIAPQDAVRLSTFHSARGIEAEHVIVLGLTELHEWKDAQNIAYVALSRATKSTEIVLTNDDAEHPVGRFAIQVREALEDRGR